MTIVHQQSVKEMTRRHFFRRSGLGIGSLALAHLLNCPGNAQAAGFASRPALLPRPAVQAAASRTSSTCSCAVAPLMSICSIRNLN